MNKMCTAQKDADILPVQEDTVGHEENKPERPIWASKLEFMLTCIGYCVGLGNIWRFPYLCYKNGGGAFLVPYTIMALLVAFPLVVLEQAAGQYAGIAAGMSFFDICPLFKGIGITYLVLNLLVTLSYIMVIVYAIYYLVASMAIELPWKHCNNAWNTPQCFAAMLNDSYNSNVTILELAENSTAHTPNLTKMISPAEEYFERYVLRQSTGIHALGALRWPLFGCLAAAWIFVFLATIRSIRSSGKVAYLTATFPYLMLTCLVVRGATLPGSLDGVAFYIVPQWHKLLDTEVWFSAALQIFYSLGPSYGIFITMASYNNYHYHFQRGAVITTLANCMTSLYAGFAVFSFLGNMASELGVSVEEVVASGPGLAFIAYPRALASLPASQLWAVAFFLMLVLLGMSSELCHFETILSSFVDTFPELRQPRKRALVGLTAAVIFFCLDILFVTEGGMYVFFLVDWYGTAFSLMLVAVLEAVILCWIYGFDRLSDNIEDMTGSRPNIFFRISWQFCIPIIILVVFMMSVVSWRPATLGTYVYPASANAAGWVLAMSSLVPIPIMALIVLLGADGDSMIEKLKVSLRPNSQFLQHVKQRQNNAMEQTGTTMAENINLT